MNTFMLMIAVFCVGPDASDKLTPIALYGERIVNPLNAVQAGGAYFLLQQNGVVRVFDDKRQVRTISEAGTEPGQLKEPTWVAVFEGDLYVLQKSGKVSVFSTEGEYQGDIQLVDPSADMGFVNGIYVYNGDFLVTYDKGAFIKRFKRHGALAATFEGPKDPYAGHMLNLLDLDFAADGKTAYVVNQFDGALFQVDLAKEKVTGEYRFAFRGVDTIVDSYRRPPDPDSPISYTRAKVLYPLQQKDGKPVVISRLQEPDGSHITASLDQGQLSRGRFVMTGVEIKPTYMKQLGSKALIVDMGGHLFLADQIW